MQKNTMEYNNLYNVAIIAELLVASGLKGQEIMLNPDNKCSDSLIEQLRQLYSDIYIKANIGTIGEIRSGIAELNCSHFLNLINGFVNQCKAWLAEPSATVAQKDNNGSEIIPALEAAISGSGYNAEIDSYTKANTKEYHKLILNPPHLESGHPFLLAQRAKYKEIFAKLWIKNVKRNFEHPERYTRGKLLALLQDAFQETIEEFHANYQKEIDAARAVLEKLLETETAKLLEKFPSSKKVSAILTKIPYSDCVQYLSMMDKSFFIDINTYVSEILRSHKNKVVLTKDEEKKIIEYDQSSMEKRKYLQLLAYDHRSQEEEQTVKSYEKTQKVKNPS